MSGMNLKAVRRAAAACLFGAAVFFITVFAGAAAILGGALPLEYARAVLVAAAALGAAALPAFLRLTRGKHTKRRKK